jgi:membrane peptidoglycan carboxypeptidase
MRLALRWAIRAMLVLLTAFVLLQLWYAAHIWWWRDHPPSETAFMTVRLAELKTVNPGARLQYAWVPYQRISVQLKRAMIAAEDARFVEHEGFDLERRAGADERLESGSSPADRRFRSSWRRTFSCREIEATGARAKRR